MLWHEVRELYPNQFVLVQALKSHITDNKKYVEEVAVIRPIPDEREATKELLRCKGDRFVYPTTKESIVIELRMRAGIRGYRQ